MNKKKCTADNMICADCWLFTGIYIDDQLTKYGICDEDGGQVLAENKACDLGIKITIKE